MININSLVNNPSKKKKLTKEEKNKKIINILSPLLAVLAALIIGGIIIWTNYKINPFMAYGRLFTAAFNKAQPKSPNFSGLAKTFATATPLIFIGLSVMFGQKVGLFNIGGQGQMIAGGIAATLVGAYTKNVLVANAFTVVIAAATAGFLWAGIVGLLKAKFGIHEVISAIMLNYIAVSFQSFFLNIKAIRDPNSANVQSPKIVESARFIILNPSIDKKLNFGFILAIIIVVLLYFFFKKTKQGYELRAVGHNPGSSENAGISIGKSIIISMGVAGALAGLAGAERIIGGAAQYSYTEQVMGSYGFVGIAVALLGKSNPIGVLIAGIFYASLEVGGQALQSFTVNGVSYKMDKQLIDMIQALIIIFIASENMFKIFVSKFIKKTEKGVEK